MFKVTFRHVWAVQDFLFYFVKISKMSRLVIFRPFFGEFWVHFESRNREDSCFCTRILNFSDVSLLKKKKIIT